MPAWLRIVGDQESEIECETVATIGRDIKSTLCIPDFQVSRNHAVIRLVGSNEYYLADLGSTNGTYINEHRVTMPKQLLDGDKILIGDTEILFRHEALTSLTGVPDFEVTTQLGVIPKISCITILVSDLRSFTPMVEQLPLEKLCQLMGEWFRSVSSLVIKNGGTVDKFIGDCVFARWDSGFEIAEAVKKSLQTAIELNKLADWMNVKHPDLPQPLRIGVGINTGDAIVDFGQESTALGDAVNLAFRLESASKDVGKPVIVSQSSYRHLPPLLWENRETSIFVKGKQQPVSIVSFDFKEIQEMLVTLKPATT